MEPVSWLPASTNTLLESTVKALEKHLGSNLLGVMLIGEAMNPSRSDRGRAPELLAVLASAKDLELSDLAHGLGSVMRAGVRVRIVTERELERSTDVFALEIADWKARHRVLAGAEVLGALTIDPADLRFGIETELRGLVRRIRNRILTGLATERGRDDPSEAIVAGYDRLLVAAYHTLALLDASPPPEEEAIVTAMGKRADIVVAPFLEHLRTVRQGEAPIDTLHAFDALLAVTERLTDFVDGLELES